MPTSRFLDTRYAKWLVIVNAFVPLALLVWDGYHHQLGVNEVNFAIKTTGIVGLTLLVLALVVLIFVAFLTRRWTACRG